MEIRSKYQVKNYEEKEFNLWETSCIKCEKPFAIDYAECKSAERDGDYDFVRIFCPYCGHKQYEHL